MKKLLLSLGVFLGLGALSFNSYSNELDNDFNISYEVSNACYMSKFEDINFDEDIGIRIDQYKSFSITCNKNTPYNLEFTSDQLGVDSFNNYDTFHLLGVNTGNKINYGFQITTDGNLTRKFIDNGIRVEGEALIGTGTRQDYNMRTSILITHNNNTKPAVDVYIGVIDVKLLF